MDCTFDTVGCYFTIRLFFEGLGFRVSVLGFRVLGFSGLYGFRF
jgi:hypothetical protein